LKTQKYNCL